VDGDSPRIERLLIAILHKQSTNVCLSMVKLRCWVMMLHPVIMVAISLLKQNGTKKARGKALAQ
jgi:hypothetical protein